MTHAWYARRKGFLLTVDAFWQVGMNFNATHVLQCPFPSLNRSLESKCTAVNGRHCSIPYTLGSGFRATPRCRHRVLASLCRFSPLGLTNTLVLICALSKSLGRVMAGRVRSGLTCARGSVTMGLVADMFDTGDREYAVLGTFHFSSLGDVLSGFWRCSTAVSRLAMELSDPTYSVSRV